MADNSQDQIVKYGLAAVFLFLVVPAFLKNFGVDPKADETVNDVQYGDPAMNFFNPNFGKFYNDAYNGGNAAIAAKIDRDWNEINDQTIKSFYGSWEMSTPNLDELSGSEVVDSLMNLDWLSGSSFYLAAVLIIKNALGGITDNEAAIKALFDRVENQYEVSMIARWFMEGEGQDLLHVLKEGAGLSLPWKGLSSTDLAAIIDRIKTLPVLPIYW